MRGIVLGAAVATTVGAIDDFRVLPLVAEARRPVARRGDPDRLRGLRAALHVPVDRRAPGAALDRHARDRRRDRRRHEHGQLPRRARRARGRRVRDLRRDVLRDRASTTAASAPAILAAIVCGACLGFLRHNFYPARIFMGDSGALLLGYTLAAVSVQGLLKTAALATLVLPLLVLAVPVLDTSFVVAKRLKSGQPIYVADARHLHHRFMRHRLLGAARGRLSLDVVRDARARRARDAVRPAAPSRRLERHEPRDRRGGRRARDRVLALRRLPARDRDAREPARPPSPPRGGTHRRLSKSPRRRTLRAPR